jgi:hypothetical protein
MRPLRCAERFNPEDKDREGVVMNSGKRLIGGLAIVPIVLFCVMFASAAEAAPWWDFGPKHQESWQSDLQPARSPESEEEQTRHHPRHGEKGTQQRPRRLSPEEHHQLRRDIKDAGKEIYHDSDLERPAP